MHISHMMDMLISVWCLCWLLGCWGYRNFPFYDRDVHCGRKVLRQSYSHFFCSFYCSGSGVQHIGFLIRAVTFSWKCWRCPYKMLSEEIREFLAQPSNDCREQVSAVKMIPQSKCILFFYMQPQHISEDFRGLMSLKFQHRFCLKLIKHMNCILYLSLQRVKSDVSFKCYSELG